MPKLRSEISPGLILSSTGGLQRRGAWGPGYERPDGYAIISIDGQRDYLHRKIWIQFRGELQPGEIVHHRNGDAGDQRLKNLQAMTRGAHSTLHARRRKRRKSDET